jgi:predicted peroxiredoxin
VAEDMAAENEVLVYMDHRATEVAFKATKDFEWNPFPKYKGQIAKLKSMGVRLTVCRPCLDAFFAKASDVMEEVEVVNPADIANYTSGRVMTLDY